VGHLEIYTDGSAKGRWGSWSFLVVHEGHVLAEASGRERQTNSNRMEFQAAIQALEYISSLGAKTRELEVLLATDCKILLENIPKFPEWRAAQWRRANHPIPNADLFEKLYALILKQAVTWKWVRAHSGNPHNERCDELCRLARDGQERIP
jgi:ribonuclease HI